MVLDQRHGSGAVGAPQTSARYQQSSRITALNLDLALQVRPRMAHSASFHTCPRSGLLLLLLLEKSRVVPQISILAFRLCHALEHDFLLPVIHRLFYEFACPQLSYLST